MQVIFGVGTDIIEIERIGAMLARGRQNLETIFTAKEIEYCEGKAHRAEHYGVRFAAKEATLKALRCGWGDGLTFCDIEILDDELGRPQVFVHGKVKDMFEQEGIQQASISLSHSKENAIAVVILEFQPGDKACRISDAMKTG